METQEIKVMQKILHINDQIAEEMRYSLKQKQILFINMMSSPGSGKTSLLEKTALNLDKKIYVIEGDIQTTLDAERLARHNINAYQINTGPFGGDCHLESSWIKSALEEIELDGTSFLFVENIGNLVCPAEFDVGAHRNAVILSVTEGEDKPLKYPLAFRNSHLCIISKIDLLPHLDVSLETIRNNIKIVNPDIDIIELSSKSETGINEWINYLKQEYKKL